MLNIKISNYHLKQMAYYLIEFDKTHILVDFHLLINIHM